MGSTRPRSKKRAKKFDALSRFRDMENQGFGIESEGVETISFSFATRYDAFRVGYAFRKYCLFVPNR
jgi:hypothetical protein